MCCPSTDTRRWGGFMLTALLTIVAILASFPLGVLLALGRRSSLPVVHWTCVIYIELVRGVPLITVLFMAQLARAAGQSRRWRRSITSSARWSA